MDDKVLDFIAWIIRALAVGAFGLGVWLRDKTRQHDMELHGPEGTNGYRRDIKDLKKSVEAINVWMASEQVKDRTISEIEKELMHELGRERSRRLRDKLRQEVEGDE